MLQKPFDFQDAITQVANTIGRLERNRMLTNEMTLLASHIGHFDPTAAQQKQQQYILEHWAKKTVQVGESIFALIDIQTQLHKKEPVFHQSEVQDMLSEMLHESQLVCDEIEDSYADVILHMEPYRPAGTEGQSQQQSMH